MILKDLFEVLQLGCTLPAYQRSFSWTARELDLFLDQVLADFAPASQAVSWFFVILMRRTRTAVYIVDGQQRVTRTLFLVHCVAYLLERQQPTAQVPNYADILARIRFQPQAELARFFGSLRRNLATILVTGDNDTAATPPHAKYASAYCIICVPNASRSMGICEIIAARDKRKVNS